MAKVRSHPFLAWLGAVFIRLVGATVRIEIDDPGLLFSKSSKRGPVIYAFWHNRLFLLPYIYEKHHLHRKFVALISASRDGQIITDIVARFNVKTARGSTSRKGFTAMKEMIHMLEVEKADIGITPDGPRGPRYVVQPGVVHLAQATGCPIVPVRFHMSCAWALPSWDKFRIPLPFSRCRLQVGPQIAVSPNEDDSHCGESCAMLQQLLGTD